MQTRNIAIAAILAAQQVYAGSVTRACLKPEVQQNFDVNRYLGLWYEARRDADCRFEATNGICNTAQYSLRDDGDIRVVNDEWEDDTSEWGGGVGKAFQVNPDDNDGYLKVKFGPFIPAGDYKVVETDYDSYTVIYTCTGLGGFYNIEYVWILTRDAQPSQEVLDKAMSAAAAKVPEYDLGQLYATPQGTGALSSGEDCPYQTAPQSVLPASWYDALIQ